MHAIKLISMYSLDWIPYLVKFWPEHTSTRVVGFFLSKQWCLWETEPINHALWTPDTNGHHRCQLTTYYKTTSWQRFLSMCALEMIIIILSQNYWGTEAPPPPAPPCSMVPGAKESNKVGFLTVSGTFLLGLLHASTIYRQPFTDIHSFRRAAMALCWKHSPLTNVTQA